MHDVRLQAAHTIAGFGKFSAALLILGGIAGAVWLVAELAQSARQMRGLGMSLGFQAYAAAALPGIAVALTGVSMLVLAKLLEVAAIMAERLANLGTDTQSLGKPKGSHNSAG